MSIKSPVDVARDKVSRGAAAIDQNVTQLLSTLFQTYNDLWTDPISWGIAAGTSGQSLMADHADASMLIVRIYCRHGLVPPIAAPTVNPKMPNLVAPYLSWVKYIGADATTNLDPTKYIISLPTTYTIGGDAAGNVTFTKNA